MDHESAKYRCPNCGQPCEVQEEHRGQNFYRRSLCCQVAPVLIVRVLDLPPRLREIA